MTKRSREHDVAKHAARFAGGVFGGPDLRERAEADADFDAGAGLLDTARAFDDFGIFPGRSKAGQGIRKGVPVVDGFGGGGHFGAIDEGFAHGEL